MVLTLLSIIDWAIITLSFFNTISLTWLGLMVILNSDRRRWGTWIGGGGMLAGGVFFVGHSFLVSQVIDPLGGDLVYWWWVGWLPFIAAPYLWYVVMGWYTGALRKSRRQRAWFLIMSLLGLSAFLLLMVANPFTPVPRVVHRLSPNTTIFATEGVVSLVTMTYPIYSMLCIARVFSELRHPVASQRFMGDLARKRAHPWLVAASLMLLLISFSGAGMASWFLWVLHSAQHTFFTLNSLALILAFDLFICGMVAITLVFIGRAVVSYEVFTGKVLPRGGLRRHWRSSLIFAASYSMLIAWSLELEVETIYILLLVTIVITLRFALTSWRSFAERERSMEQLRPFVTSQRIYERMLTSPHVATVDIDAVVPLRALCEDVLDARLAYLMPLGALASLAGAPLAHSSEDKELLSAPHANIAALAEQFTLHTLYVPLDPSHYGGAVLAVPLWSERGLIGVLLLGSKRDNGLYTQEEIEIARAVGERLIDIQASAEMARRLMALQRQRLTQSQVADRRTRRVLHDDVLPQLHTAMLMLSGTVSTTANGSARQVVELLTSAHRQIADLLHAMPATAAPEVARLGLVGALRQVVEKELVGAFDTVAWQVESEAEQALRVLPPLAAEVMFYAGREVIRNAARYARGSDPSRPLNLVVAARCGEDILFVVEDDGVGIETPAASVSSDLAAEGKGHGLALHSTMMAVVGGALTIESVPQRFTRVTLSLPREAVS